MKIQGMLHDHIDGSRAMLEILPLLYKEAGVEAPCATLEEWQAFFANPQVNLVQKFGAVTSVLQDQDSMFLAGYTYGKFRAKQGLKYAEAKFAPQYHTTKYDLFDMTYAMTRGLKRAERDFNITILPQLCIGREADENMGIEIARLVLEYAGEVALDLACDEGGFPPEKHLAAYKLTFGSRVKRDCHAGEWVRAIPGESREAYRARLLQNVRTAVYDLKCHGVGHAIPLCDNEELARYMADNGVRVAGCPLSNLHSGLIQNIEELQIPRLLELGVQYTVSVDDDLLFPTVPELEESCTKAGITEAHWGKMHENLRASAWHPDAKGFL
jgi:adenosine deaminase